MTTDRIEGMDNLDQQLKNLAKSVKPEIVEPMLLDAGKELVKQGKPITPYDPTRTKGTHLRDAWVAKKLDRWGGIAPTLAGMNYRKAPHASLVEFGTVRASPHPYFRPTWDANKDKLRNEIIQKLKKSIEESI